MNSDEPTNEQKICPNPACCFDKHPPGANFCMLCGTLLYQRCDNCLEKNPRYAKYCYLCGTNLEELRLSKLQDESAAGEDTAPPETPPHTEPQEEENR